MLTMRKLTRHLIKLGMFMVVVLLVSHLISNKNSSHIPKTLPPAVACIGYRGRLGNLMFQYAFLYSMSRIKGLYPVIPENFQPSEAFKINKTTWKLLGLDRSPCNNITSYTERWPCSFDDKLLDAPILKSAKFNGYFQSWKYWIQYENNLREIFRFQDKIAKRADKQLRDILSTMDFPCCSENTTLVGVHIRRGDYTSQTMNDYGQITPNSSYYQHAMDFFEKLYPQVLFIVASDDLRWTKNALKSRENVYISLGNFGPEDMALLSLTNHTIMSVGTFGWWVGWMTKGMTLYYKPIFAPGSRFSKDFNNDPSNFIYPGWTPML